MIDKIHRFQGHGSLRFVYQKGQIVRGAFCSLKYIINRRRETYRVAVVVSRKVHKSAVVRNRIRRRIYEAFRQMAEDITEPYDLVFMVYSEQLATIPSSQVNDVIREKLSKAGIIRDSGISDGATRAIVDAKEKAQ